jgi:uncharacterized protein YecE (DUF72 family)
MVRYGIPSGVPDRYVDAELKIQYSLLEHTMATVKIGACSFNYPSWEGSVYSEKASVGYLSQYAKKYSIVEIDRWFWSLFGTDNVSLPKAETVHDYLYSTPENFRFAIKVPNSVTLTHFYRQKKTEELIPNPYFLSRSLFESFLERIAPLRDKIDCLIFQFEYLNKQKMASHKVFLDTIGSFFSQTDFGYPLAIEIRNKNYLNKAYFTFLNTHRLFHVFMQGYWMPNIEEVYLRYYDFIREKTVIRLMGYDRKDMEKKTGNRWDSVVEPKDNDILAIAKMIRDLLHRDISVTVNINNHYEGSAPVTIEKFKNLLSTAELGTSQTKGEL